METKPEVKPIKSTLRAMSIGAQTVFPRRRRGALRITANNLKVDEGKVFKTWVKEDKIFIERIK